MRTLDDWLSILIAKRRPALLTGEQSPHPWELEMKIAWMLGARTFGKIPAAVGQVGFDGKAPSPTCISGPVRPLICPEPPPAGSEFYLAWHDGAGWRNSVPIVASKAANLPVVEDPNYWNRVRPDFAFATRALKLEADRVATESFDALVKRAAENGSYIDCLLESAESHLAEKGLEGLIKMAFEMGVHFGRKDALEEMRPILDLAAKRDKSEEWVDVAFGAINRHEGLTALKLLRKMGGHPVDEATPNPDGSNNIRRFWIFPDSTKIEQVVFESSYKSAKNRLRNSGVGGQE